MVMAKVTQDVGGKGQEREVKPGCGEQLASPPSFFTGQRAPTWRPVAGRDKDRSLS